MKKSKYTEEQKKEIVNARFGGLSFKEIYERWKVYGSQVITWAKLLKVNLKEGCAKTKQHRSIKKDGLQKVPKLTNGDYDMDWLHRKNAENDFYETYLHFTKRGLFWSANKI